MEDIITLKGLADRLGVDPSRVRYWISVGKVPAGQKVGRERVFTPSEAAAVEKWAVAWLKARERLILDGGSYGN